MLGRIAQHTGLKPIKTLCFTLFALLACAFGGQAALADDETGTAPKTVETVLVAELKPEFQVVLEGETLSAEVSKDADGAVYVRAEPIFKALNDEFEYNVDEGVLVVQRSQDGVVMELFTETGLVKANGRTLGKLAGFGEISEGKINLTPNAIAVLSGALGKLNADEKVINFELDPRLKVATGFEVFVNDIPLGNLQPGPKSIGSVLLLPLRPIAKELGHELQILDGGSVVKVRRSQDSAEFEMNLDTGLIKLNGRPIGVTNDVTYIESVNLLLPISAIEALTGTHISVEGGSSRINIVLDERLKGAVKPGERIDDVTKNTPFTLETIEFHTGIDTLNTARAEFRVKGINGQIRYEIPDLPTSIKEAEPSWLSLDYAHVNGGYGALGDYSADLRELDGVGIRRIRGVSYAKENDKGRWAVAAGVPTSGSKRVSEDQSRQTFGGFAAGVRYADRDGWEAGVSYKADGLSDDQMAVLSAISGRLGRGRDTKLNWDVRADAGVFSGSAREKSVDVRASGNARYEVNNNINVDISAGYDGAEFLRSDLNVEDRQALINEGDETVENTEQTPDIRARGRDYLSYGAAVQVAARKDIGPLVNPAASVRYNKNISGAFAGSETRTSVDTYGVSLNTQLKKINTNLSVDFAGYTQNLQDGSTETGDQFTARALQDVKYAKVRLQYSSARKGDAARIQRLDGQITAKPYNIELPKAAHLSVAPSVAASWSDTSNSVSGGVVAQFDGGEILGKKTELKASLGVLQSFSSNTEKKSDKFLSVSLGRNIPIGKNMQLGLSYRNDLRGEQRVGVFLDGRFGLNAKRKFKKAKDGRGVLKGRAFLDKNRDGIKQDDEPGIRGAVVRIVGTRLALRTDSEGYYTIQNVKQGVLNLQVDNRSLPLGFTLADNAASKASIRAGHITDVPLPIVQRGQILGFAYVDANGDGEHSKGETRLEGAKLVLTDVDDKENTHQAYAASFGQYAFDDLPAAQYELTIYKTNSPDSAPSAPVLINLAEADNLMARINIAAITMGKTQMAEQNLTGMTPKGVITAREEEIPPPEIRATDPAP